MHFFVIERQNQKTALIFAMLHRFRKMTAGIAKIPGGIFFLILFFDAKEKESIIFSSLPRERRFFWRSLTRRFQIYYRKGNSSFSL